MEDKRFNFTPDNITRLQPRQVVVFETDKQGTHSKGLALTALKQFGAVYGQAEGIQGQCYSIITKELNAHKPMVTLHDIEKSIIRFFDYAANNPESQFLITKVGCGIGRFKPADIATIFNDYYEPDIHTNVIFPREFCFYIDNYVKD